MRKHLTKKNESLHNFCCFYCATGYRDEKQWFLVRDKERPKIKYILTIMPKAEEMTLPFTSNTEKYLNELMVLLEVIFNCY